MVNDCPDCKTEMEELKNEQPQPYYVCSSCGWETEAFITGGKYGI